jgi:hypothetical protein
MILTMQWIIRATSIIEDELDRLNRPEVALCILSIGMIYLTCVFGRRAKLGENTESA